MSGTNKRTDTLINDVYLKGARLRRKQIVGVASLWKKAFVQDVDPVGGKAYFVRTYRGAVQDVLDLGSIGTADAAGTRTEKTPSGEVVMVPVHAYPAVGGNLAERARRGRRVELPNIETRAALHSQPDAGLVVGPMIVEVSRRPSIAHEVDTDEEMMEEGPGPMPERPSPEMLAEAAAAARHGGTPSTVHLTIDQAIPSAEGKAVYFETTAAGRAAHFIRAARQAAGFTQSDLARKLEVAQSRIAELEKGTGVQGPTLGLLERIAAACGRRLLLAVE
jgi:DNA-binding XRE family transcriptional regulator